MNEIPTPESDEVFGPRVTGVRSRKCRDLERRLTIANNALLKIGYINGRGIPKHTTEAGIARAALTLTAPKP